VTIVGLFAAAAYRLMPSMNRLINSMVSMRQTTFAIETLEEFRDYAEAARNPVAQLSLRFELDLVFDHVSFAFPTSEALVLNDISFRVRKGEKVGLIGSSGSGKTTLMNILLRFYQEQQGSVLVDGIPLNEHNLAAWYQLIGYVKQETFLTEASIRDNITLNEKYVNEKRLQYALEQASLLDFVATLPEGVDTLIGERGSRLSGGQRQRIGIVNEAINKLSHTDITIIIIAHRLTTLRGCDRIYELKEGKLVAEHAYQDLAGRLH